MQAETKTENVFQLKFIVVGTKESGLEDFLMRLNKSRQDFSKTLGINIYTSKIYNKNRIYQINLWNLAEAPSGKAKKARSLFTQGANGVLIIFNGNDPEGLEKIKPAIKEIDEIVQFGVPRVLVGNMVNERSIKFEEAQKFAKEHHFLFAERFKYDMDVLLLSLCLLSLREPVPLVYQQIFGDNYHEYLEKKLNILPSDLVQDVKEGSGVAGEEWMGTWEKMWSLIKEEEEFIIDQRLARLESDLNQVLSDFYTSHTIISPLLEFFQVPDPGDTKFPALVKTWLDESPDKLNALRNFLKNNDNIQEKYWHDFYQLRQKMVSNKIKILSKFHDQMHSIIEENENNLKKIEETLKSEEIPKRILVDMAETIHFVEELIRKYKK